MKDFLYMLGCGGLTIAFTLMVLDGWSSSDYQADPCEQREAWEATGHEYVGIPHGSEDCQ